MKLKCSVFKTLRSASCLACVGALASVLSGPVTIGSLNFAQPAFAQAGKTVEAIDVVGLRRIEKSTVLSYLTIQEGDVIQPLDVNNSLKAIYATGFFADVAFDVQGNTLIVSVKENPIVNIVAFEGNDKIDDEALESEIRLRSRVVYTRSKVKADVDRILQVYRRSGRFSVTVEPKIILLDQNRLNVVFEIDEGPETSIRAVNFIGNKHFTDKALRSEILTRESRWYRFLSATDTYDEDRIAFDEELLRRFYLSQGYAEFKVESAISELTPDRKDFFVTFTVFEGERYKFGNVVFENNLEDLDISEFKKITDDLSGDWYDADEVEDISLELTEKAGNLQYGFVDIRPNIELNREEKVVDLTYVINESPRIFVERVDIFGNVRTLDRVIRREIILAEGDPYNLTKAKKSEQRIRDLNFFQNVSFETKRGSRPDLAIIEVEVEEKSTGELSIGAGFSTLDGPLADFRIRESNFLGKGQNLQFASTIAGNSQQFDISFTEPYFMDRELALGFDVFHITRDFQEESSFDQERSGGALRAVYPLAKDLTHGVQYSLEDNEITDVEADASRFIREQEGTRLTSEISHKLTLDKRNSKIDPTEGYILSWSNGLAGLGGDAEYLSTRAYASTHHPFFDNKVVFSLQSEFGYIFGLNGEDIFITDRYFIGGQTLRGFDRSGIGPRDITTGDALGGNRFIRGSAEVAFPIGLPDELGVKGILFTDVGTLGDIDESDPDIADEESLRIASGFGISWQSPFGPIKAYVGIPLMKEDYDEERIFQFNFGTSF